MRSGRAKYTTKDTKVILGTLASAVNRYE